MALYAKVNCENCGSTFEVHSREVQRSGKPIRCPHCLRKMTEKQWDAFVDAFFTVTDLNYQAVKAHEECGEALFTVDLVYNHIHRDLIILD